MQLGHLRRQVVVAALGSDSDRPMWIAQAAVKIALVLPLASIALGLNPGPAHAARKAQAAGISETIIDASTGMPQDWVYSTGHWGQEQLTTIHKFYTQMQSSTQAPAQSRSSGAAPSRSSTVAKAAAAGAVAAPSAMTELPQKVLDSAGQISQDGLRAVHDAYNVALDKAKSTTEAIDLNAAAQWSQEQVNQIQQLALAVLNVLRQLTTQFAEAAHTSAIAASSAVTAKSQQVVAATSQWGQQSVQAVQGAAATVAASLKQKPASASAVKSKPAAAKPQKAQQAAVVPKWSLTADAQRLAESAGHWSQQQVASVKQATSSAIQGIKDQAVALKAKATKPAAPAATAKAAKKTPVLAQKVQPPSLTLPKLTVPKLTMPQLSMPQLSAPTIDGPLADRAVQQVVGAVAITILGLLMAQRLSRHLSDSSNRGSSSTTSSSSASYLTAPSTTAMPAIATNQSVPAAAAATAVVLDDRASWYGRSVPPLDADEKLELQAEAQRRIEAAKQAALRLAQRQPEEERGALAGDISQDAVLSGKSEEGAQGFFSSIADRLRSATGGDATATTADVVSTTTSSPPAVHAAAPDKDFGNASPMIALLALFASASDAFSTLLAPLPKDNPGGELGATTSSRQGRGKQLLVSRKLPRSATSSTDGSDNEEDGDDDNENGNGPSSGRGGGGMDLVDILLAPAAPLLANLPSRKASSSASSADGAPPTRNKYDAFVELLHAAMDRPGSQGEDARYDPVRCFLQQVPPGGERYDFIRNTLRAVVASADAQTNKVQGPSTFDMIGSLLRDWSSGGLLPQSTKYDPVQELLHAATLVQDWGPAASPYDPLAGLAGWEQPSDWGYSPYDPVTDLLAMEAPTAISKYDPVSVLKEVPQWEGPASSAAHLQFEQQKYDPLRWLVDGWAGQWQQFQQGRTTTTATTSNASAVTSSWSSEPVQQLTQQAQQQQQQQQQEVEGSPGSSFRNADDNTSKEGEGSNGNVSGFSPAYSW